MLQKIVEHLKSVFNDTGYFQKIFPLCVLINVEGFTNPAHYLTGGKFEEVSLFGQNEGLGYFRKTGNVSIEKASVKKLTSCADDFNDYVYALKFIGCVPKKKADCDNEYADDVICNRLISSINNLTDLASEIGARSSNIRITEYKTGSSEIMQSEFGGKAFEFDFKYSVFSLSIQAVITASSECFNSYCYGQN